MIDPLGRAVDSYGRTTDSVIEADLRQVAIGLNASTKICSSVPESRRPRHGIWLLLRLFELAILPKKRPRLHLVNTTARPLRGIDEVHKDRPAAGGQKWIA